MFGKKQDSEQKSIVSGGGMLLEIPQETKKDEKTIPDDYILEFISKHHLNRLWEEFLYEKTHSKTPLSAADVLAMINLTPEEQEKILQEHE